MTEGRRSRILSEWKNSGGRWWRRSDCKQSLLPKKLVSMFPLSEFDNVFKPELEQTRQGRQIFFLKLMTVQLWEEFSLSTAQSSSIYTRTNWTLIPPFKVIFFNSCNGCLRNPPIRLEIQQNFPTLELFAPLCHLLTITSWPAAAFILRCSIFSSQLWKPSRRRHSELRGPT